MHLPHQIRYIKILAILSYSLFFSCRHIENQKLTIAVAANMQYAMSDLQKEFKNQTGIESDIIIGSSGKLYAQIIEGAPFDLFISADTKYPNKIYESRKGSESPLIYAHGKLVLWTISKKLTPDLSLLDDEDIVHIAIAQPLTAPYGQAALEVIENTSQMELVEQKLVYGESIAQVNQFIISGAADMGFTSMAVVKSSNLMNTGQWIEVDSSLYTPIAQSLILLNNRKDKKKEAQSMIDFIMSKKGKSILANFGYSVELQ